MMRRTHLGLAPVHASGPRSECTLLPCEPMLSDFLVQHGAKTFVVVMAEEEMNKKKALKKRK